jgi:hypothetical protein
VKVRADLTNWKAIRNAIVRTEKRVKVGILNDSQHANEDGGDEDISLLELAAIHEFGSPAAGIPERSFIRATINGKRDAVNEAIEEIVGLEVKKLLEIAPVSEMQADAAARRALGKLGTKLVSMIRATIRNRQTVGPEDQTLKPETIRRKGSSLPLVDTGQLVNGLNYAVVDGKGGDE